MNRIPMIGEPAPWFHAPALEGNPRYAFDTAAGRWIVMLFIGQAGRPECAAALALLAAERDLFDDANVCLFGVTIDPTDAAQGRIAQQLPGVEVNVGDAGMLPFPDRAADLVLCIEVLEHLPTVEPAVAELARITGDRCVVSVPWEPWFRLGNLGRGKNIGRLGNDPEHLRAFSPRSLRRTLERSFAEVRIVPVFPWLVAEARRPI